MNTPPPQSAAPTAVRWGVVLVQLGTPDSPAVSDVRRYLREFLSDPRVIDLPAPARWLLLNLVILPFRPKRSAAAYAKIWTEQGSPLRFHSAALAEGIGEHLGERVVGVELGMRYGNPSIAGAVDKLLGAGASGILILPLFPQYSQSAWESAAAAVFRAVDAHGSMPAVRVLPPFFDEPAFIDAAAAVARRELADFGADRVLISFHGIPERHVLRSDQSGDHCLQSPDCCDRLVAANRFCYRAQCYASARALARALELADSDYEVAFQSRLGRTPWIVPYTDQRVAAMPAEGVRRLAVMCPSFVADCLETVEEIGIRARDDFRAAGGEELILIPCVNSDPKWVAGLGDLCTANLPGS